MDRMTMEWLTAENGLEINSELGSYSVARFP